MPQVLSFSLGLTPGPGPPLRCLRILSTRKPRYRDYCQRRSSTSSWPVSTQHGQLEADCQSTTIATWRKSSQRLGGIPSKCVLFRIASTMTTQIYQTVHECHSLWQLGWESSFLHLRISRSMGVDFVACARRIVGAYEHVEFREKVLLPW